MRAREGCTPVCAARCTFENEFGSAVRHRGSQSCENAVKRQNNWLLKKKGTSRDGIFLLLAAGSVAYPHRASDNFGV